MKSLFTRRTDRELAAVQPPQSPPPPPQQPQPLAGINALTGNEVQSLASAQSPASAGRPLDPHRNQVWDRRTGYSPSAPESAGKHVFPLQRASSSVELHGSIPLRESYSRSELERQYSQGFLQGQRAAWNQSASAQSRSPHASAHPHLHPQSVSPHTASSLSRYPPRGYARHSGGAHAYGPGGTGPLYLAADPTLAPDTPGAYTDTGRYPSSLPGSSRGHQPLSVPSSSAGRPPSAFHMARNPPSVGMQPHGAGAYPHSLPNSSAGAGAPPPGYPRSLPGSSGGAAAGAQAPYPSSLPGSSTGVAAVSPSYHSFGGARWRGGAPYPASLPSTADVAGVAHTPVVPFRPDPEPVPEPAAHAVDPSGQTPRAPPTPVQHGNWSLDEGVSLRPSHSGSYSAGSSNAVAAGAGNIHGTAPGTGGCGEEHHFSWNSQAGGSDHPSWSDSNYPSWNEPVHESAPGWDEQLAQAMTNEYAAAMYRRDPYGFGERGISPIKESAEHSQTASLNASHDTLPTPPSDAGARRTSPLNPSMVGSSVVADSASSAPPLRRRDGDASRAGSGVGEGQVQKVHFEGPWRKNPGGVVAEVGEGDIGPAPLDFFAVDDEDLLVTFPPDIHRPSLEDSFDDSLKDSFESEMSATAILRNLIGRAHRKVRNHIFLHTLGHHRPYFVVFTCLLNLGIFMYTMHYNNCPEHSDNCLEADALGRFSFEATSVNPLYGPSPRTLLNMGAKSTELIVEKGEPWRLVAAVYLHVGVVHVLSNVAGTLAYGWTLEKDHGWMKVAWLYNLSGISSMMWSAIMKPKGLTVGASGASLGMFGCNFANLVMNWSVLDEPMLQIPVLLVAAGVEAFMGLAPYVDNVSHIAGFATGLLFGFIFFYHPRIAQDIDASGPLAGVVRAQWQNQQGHQWVLIALAAPMLVAMMFLSFVLLFAGIDVSGFCGCEGLDCQDTFLWTCPNYNPPGAELMHDCNTDVFPSNMTTVISCVGSTEAPLTIIGEQLSQEFLDMLCDQQCAH